MEEEFSLLFGLFIWAHRTSVRFIEYAGADEMEGNENERASNYTTDLASGSR